MADLPPARDYEMLLGRLVADRLGLDPRVLVRDGMTVEDIGSRAVMVSFTTMAILPVDDLRELEALAHSRWMAGEGRG